MIHITLIYLTLIYLTLEKSNYEEKIMFMKT